MKYILRRIKMSDDNKRIVLISLYRKRAARDKGYRKAEYFFDETGRL